MPLAAEDLRPLLDGVDLFARECVATATARPEQLVDDATLDALTREATELGIRSATLDDEAFGLWSDTEPAPSLAFSAHALVTPIRFALPDDRFHGAVVDPSGDGDIIELAGDAGVGIPGPLLNLILYSRRGGAMLRTLVNTRGGAHICLGGSMRLTVAAGSAHPMAQRLRSLGLADACPALVMHTQRLQLRLNAGAILPRDKAPAGTRP